MKKFLNLLLLVFIVMQLASCESSSMSNQDSTAIDLNNPSLKQSSTKAKVQINHKGNVIEVSESAVPAHLAHGDSLVDDGDDDSGDGGSDTGQK